MTLVELSQIFSLICSLLFLLKLANIAWIDCRSILYLDKDFVCIQGTSALFRKKPCNYPWILFMSPVCLLQRIKVSNSSIRGKILFKNTALLYLFFFLLNSGRVYSLLQHVLKVLCLSPYSCKILIFNRNYSQGNLNEAQNFKNTK